MLAYNTKGRRWEIFARGFTTKSSHLSPLPAKCSSEGPINLLGLVHRISGFQVELQGFQGFKAVFVGFQHLKYSKGFRSDFKKYGSGVEGF